ncbi:SLBB domain-containing protein [Ferruginibacter lapsinanis]|uniref:SLBB domain-containing protein n=1 Tax=Ferruginibacter lapsinanis TaxID=563172 RepID=UPI001E33DA33|nr:SLBB domain-containing protein [Ferruginibacter lapsinanis]UEG50576.1 SLBB domain-containing protein [Ferruginibacter lapsinanis]
MNDLSNAKIDSYSDDEIKSFYEKAMESGMTEAQLYRLAVEKGLSNAEMIKLRNRLQTINIVKKPAINTDDNQSVTDGKKEEIQHAYDTAKKSLPKQSFENDAEIFGSELFTSNSLVFEPNLRIPTPAGYILGPDDEIIVNVYGFSEKSYNLKVNEEGYIYIQNVGPIYVSGLSMDQAGEKIKAKMASSIYKAIGSGQTKVQISLGKIRSIRVTVIGEAKKPGTFTVSSLTTLYNILYLCGGPTKMGTYRKIELIRGNEVKRSADLYSFLLKGNQKDNILLQEGDVIRIPYYKTRVSIEGEVKRKGKFEVLDKENFNDLLEFCGGFTDNAFKGSISVERIAEKEKTMLDLDAKDFDTFKPKGSDKYFIGKLLDRFENRIIISGSVFRPGPYQLTEGLTVKNLIERAGGITEDAYTVRATIFRNNIDKTPTTLSVSIDSVLKYNQTVYLQKDDSISVHSIFDFRDKYMITVKGEVKKPGDYRWRENLSVKDLLLSIGGLTDFGDSSKIEISRRLKNADVSKVNHTQTDIFIVNLANNKDILLQPYDIISVKNLPGYANQRNVLILGEVLSPGQYSLSKSADRISDVFKRVGGFKASADTTSVKIRRYVQSELSAEEREAIFKRVYNLRQDSLSTNDRLKKDVYKTSFLISINLSEAMRHPDGPENITLEDGDIITIDRNTSLVKVSGEVYFPTVVPYDGNVNLRYYIKRAGNYTGNARKVGTMVIYPDGKVKIVKRFLFFKSYPKVTSRSEIFVPQKSVKNKARMTTGEWALLVSALGIVANVIITSRK